jgi:hypothetical protein
LLSCLRGIFSACSSEKVNKISIFWAGSLKMVFIEYRPGRRECYEYYEEMQQCKSVKQAVPEPSWIFQDLPEFSRILKCNT